MARSGILVINVWRKASISEVVREWARRFTEKLVWCDLSDFAIVIRDGKVSIHCRNVDLVNFKYVWIQYSWKSNDIAYAIALYLDHYGIPHSHVEPCFSKLVDLVKYGLNEMPVPETFFCFTEDLLKNIYRAEDICGYPMIMKDTRGECGIDVYLAKTRSHVMKILRKFPVNKKLLCQRFIPNEFDYRILVGNGKALVGEKRIRPKGEYRNNVSVGAKEKFLPLYEIPAEVRELALLSAKVIGLPWSGVDIVTDSVTGEHYILEINRRPGITYGTPEALAVAQHLGIMCERELATSGLVNDAQLHAVIPCK